MTIDIVDGIRTLQLDMIATVALAGLLLLLGYAVRSKATILEKNGHPRTSHRWGHLCVGYLVVARYWVGTS